ncbi:MAG TPA: hypothetical protein VK840_05835 [Candidatus Dormibacteraeota bacterium]|jgi:hypothetical protein|nr:hypothetical protein [Candidatus Dormibacteraeota bacterium]
MKIQKAFALLLFGSSLIFLCSCASVGTKFRPPDVDTLQFGKMQTSDALTLFGKPHFMVKDTTADGSFEIYKYEYTKIVFGNVSQRVLLLEFKEGKLNGYFCWSSFKQDKSRFDPKAVDKLKAGTGKLTNSDVLALVGKPDGKALCPSTIVDFKERCAKNTEVWGWYMKDNISVWDPENIKITELFVSFDANSKVSDVESEETTEPAR